MCTPWFSINPTQFYDRSATLAATSLAALIVVTACGAKDAQAHSVRAVASPPFLWTDVSPPKHKELRRRCRKNLEGFTTSAMTHFSVVGFRLGRQIIHPAAG